MGGNVQGGNVLHPCASLGIAVHVFRRSARCNNPVLTAFILAQFAHMWRSASPTFRVAACLRKPVFHYNVPQPTMQNLRRMALTIYSQFKSQNDFLLNWHKSTSKNQSLNDLKSESNITSLKVILKQSQKITKSIWNHDFKLNDHSYHCLYGLVNDPRSETASEKITTTFPTRGKSHVSKNPSIVLLRSAAVNNIAFTKLITYARI